MSIDTLAELFLEWVLEFIVQLSELLLECDLEVLADNDKFSNDLSGIGGISSISLLSYNIELVLIRNS